METQTRILIDYATGENWELPLALYEKYGRDCGRVKHFESPSQTWIQYWMTTLSDEEKKLISKR